MTEEPEYFFRYSDPEYSGGELYLGRHRVERRTPSGVWVRQYESSSDDLKFINFSWKKQFAHATVEQAHAAYIKRKLRQIEILEAQLAHAKVCHDLAVTGKYPVQPFVLFTSEPS